MSRAFAVRQAEQEVEENDWQCETCSAPRCEESCYCAYCCLYWQDVADGLFAEDA